MTLFANRDVPIELEAVEQALAFVDLQGTIDDIAGAERAGTIAPFWGDEVGRLERVVLTPDFHRGGGIPVGTVGQARGFVVPQAVGNDVCCGMRLLVTDITRDELAPHLDTIHRPLRAVFFQGQRELPMSPRQREALLREGLWGLHETRADNAGTGLWRHYDERAQEADLARVHFQGVLPAQGTFAFADYIASSGATDSRDSQIGSIGGGNHFVELQVIDEILDGTTAHTWGIAANTVAIMAHSGSVGLGHPVGGFFLDRARDIYPKQLKRPDHGFYVIPTRGPHAALGARYLDAMRNAANFAFGRHVDERTYASTFERLRVVAPIDPTAPDVRLRRDVLSEYHDRLKEEAPYAYKDITPVVQTVEDAAIARRVARMWPLLTIKG